MKKFLATYNQSLALEELGFREPCFGGWNHPFENKGPYLQLNQECEYDIKAPLKSQVFEFFRETFKIQALVQEYLLNTYMFTIDDGINSDMSVVGFETYEQAESACIDKLIEIVKNK